MAICPECESNIEVDDELEEGQTLDCPDCGAELEVVSTHPLELNAVLSDEKEEDDGYA